ncbi:Golgi apparatus membrane protein TVP38-like protein 2 [Phlyctema vagabunda]|uniref:Golgi apparatus membrane protein TVP38 n=1 Tax=Phlyctema vagabunda TaxID=108571 RepID=A0ABR4PSH7_9HELO
MSGPPTLEHGRPAREEVEEYEYKDIQWKDFFTKPKYIPWWILIIALNVIVILVTINHNKIVEALQPISRHIRDLDWGFVIPVVILVLISFPPLFGHEIVALLCGVVYGLWIGFAIVAVGTFIGEIGTWFAFKYAFRRKAVKLEKTNLNYGALARVTRDGGFLVVLIIRFSVIPSHFSTAVFSTCNVNFWYFAIATFLTLPKQIILVYVGVILVQEQSDSKVKVIVLFLTFLITVIAGVYIYMKMRNVKKVLLAEQTARKDELAAKKELENQASFKELNFREDGQANTAWI